MVKIECEMEENPSFEIEGMGEGLDKRISLITLTVLLMFECSVMFDASDVLVPHSTSNPYLYNNPSS